MKRLILLIGVVALYACGGGGGGDGTSGNDGGDSADPSPPAPQNQNPVARPGSDETVDEGTIVSLNGSASSDSDGTVIAYQWEQLSGLNVTISNGSQEQASFVAPDVFATTELTFQLTVTDDDGATSSDTVTITVRAVKFNLSGSITVPTGSVADSDVNDPNAAFSSNDTPGLAQNIPNPVTVGGYVNVPGSGELGRSTLFGDTSDYYRISLVAGETITLVVAEPTEGDPDLYLWNASGTLILDASAGIGPVETLIAPTTDDFIVEAFAFAGASNYVLVIGLDQTAGLSSGYRLSHDFVPGQAIIRYQQSTISSTGRTKQEAAVATLGFRELAGAPERELLMELDQRTDRTEAFKALGVNTQIDSREQSFLSDEQRRKWDTLIAIKALNRDPAIAYAEPNYILQSSAVPNDEFYGLQWHYPLINLPAAWDITVGDPNVTVAVIDTGVLLGHPDMQGQLIPGYDFIRDPQSANDGDGIDPNPDDPGNSVGSTSSRFHGTHVAGTIAAATDNTSGVAGVAWNARIMPLRVLGEGGFGTFFDVRQAIRYAAGLSNDSGSTANPPVDVINLSLGGPFFSQADQDLINEVRSAGVVVVAAAGNEASTAPFYPAAYDGVISVSAVTLDRTLTVYSNTGPTIDVTAPGGDNGVDVNGDGYPDGVLSSSGSQSFGSIQFLYRFIDGTSMAAPHVAGVIALMKSVSPNLTPSDIDNMLANGDLTEDLGTAGRDDLYGHGLINAQKAVAAALNAIGTPPADNPMLDVSPSSINFGTAGTAIEMSLRNTGGGFLQFTNVFATPAVPWLSLFNINVDVNGLGSYLLVADRSGLASGTYSTTISFESNVNTVQVPVIMQVTASPTTGDTGFTYVLLLDSETFANVDEVSGAPIGGTLQYQFVDVEPGEYEIIAGTDADNDFFICDSGEACGIFPTLDQPSPITLDRDLTGINFGMSYTGEIPTPPPPPPPPLGSPPAGTEVFGANGGTIGFVSASQQDAIDNGSISGTEVLLEVPFVSNTGFSRITFLVWDFNDDSVRMYDRASADSCDPASITAMDSHISQRFALGGATSIIVDHGSFFELITPNLEFSSPPFINDLWVEGVCTPGGVNEDRVSVTRLFLPGYGTPFKTQSASATGSTNRPSVARDKARRHSITIDGQNRR